MVPRADLDGDHSDGPLTQEQIEVGEILSELFGRSRRQAVELEAVLARLEQLKIEIRLHQAKLKARGENLQAVIVPSSGIVSPPTVVSPATEIEASSHQ